MDGLEKKLSLPPSADTPYEDQADPLPRNLAEALECLRNDEAMCAGFGRPFIEYFAKIKEAEIARFQLEVSDWEHREYFDLF